LQYQEVKKLTANYTFATGCSKPITTIHTPTHPQGEKKESDIGAMESWREFNFWKLPVLSTASSLEMLGIALGQPLGKFRVNADPSRSFSARLSVC